MEKGSEEDNGRMKFRHVKEVTMDRNEVIQGGKEVWEERETMRNGMRKTGVKSQGRRLTEGMEAERERGGER